MTFLSEKDFFNNLAAPANGLASAGVFFHAAPKWSEF